MADIARYALKIAPLVYLRSTWLPDGRTMVATLFDANQVEFIPTPD